MGETNNKDIAVAEIEAVAQIVSAAIAKGLAVNNIPSLIEAVTAKIKNKFD